VEVQTDTERIAAICKALAHPVRVRIVAHLKAMEHCICGQIVDVLPLAQSTVSQHLKILKESGLVKGTIEGPRTCYCLDRNVLAEFKAMANRL
jgi:DNA-binding transcriptional ArsR family regulator